MRMCKEGVMAELVRKGMPSVKLDRDEFERRRDRFRDPAFSSLSAELDAIVAAAWDAYSRSRKAPVTRKAGFGFADPDYEIAADWFNAREAIDHAQQRHDNAGLKLRILVINGSSRSEHTCPGEMSKTWRMLEIAESCSERWTLTLMCSIYRDRHRSLESKFIHVSPAYRPRWRSATGRAAVTPTIRWDRPTTG
jgi:hypothetical protein